MFCTIGLCAYAHSLIQIQEGPSDASAHEGTFHLFTCVCSNTSSTPFWSINGTAHAFSNLPVGHSAVDEGLLVFVSEYLNGTSYQCFHVDRTTLETVASSTAVLQVSGKPQISQVLHLIKQSTHRQGVVSLSTLDHDQCADVMSNNHK